MGNGNRGDVPYGRTVAHGGLDDRPVDDDMCNRMYDVLSIGRVQTRHRGQPDGDRDVGFYDADLRGSGARCGNSSFDTGANMLSLRKTVCAGYQRVGIGHLRSY